MWNRPEQRDLGHGPAVFLGYFLDAVYDFGLGRGEVGLPGGAVGRLVRGDRSGELAGVEWALREGSAGGTERDGSV